MAALEKTLYIIIGCDTDPDRPGFVDGVTGECRSWRGLAEGIPLYKEIAEKLRDSADSKPKITWLLRADEQVRSAHGDYAWVMHNYNSYLQQLEADGDELGWHPHFYMRDKSSSIWYQEVDDSAWQIEMLDKAYNAYVTALPGRARSVRMGWDFHNNATMKKLNDLEVQVEFSALPGLRTKKPADYTKSYNVFDWFISPRHPYFPSEVDYRRGPRALEQSLNILEIPIFTSSSLIWGALSGLQFARKMKDPSQLLQALRRPTYVINITGKPKLFSPILADLSRVIRSFDQSTFFFVTYFHADELLNNKSSLYSRHALGANIKSILDLCSRLGVASRFIKASQARAIIKK